MAITEPCFNGTSFRFRKDLGLFVSIISRKVPFKVLKQILQFIMLVKENVSLLLSTGGLYTNIINHF